MRQMISRSLRRSAWLALLWCVCESAQAQSGCTPVAVTAGTPNQDICYGPAAWREPTLGGTWQQQRFDLYRAPGASADAHAHADRLGASQRRQQGDPAGFDGRGRAAQASPRSGLFLRVGRIPAPRWSTGARRIRRPMPACRTTTWHARCNSSVPTLPRCGIDRRNVFVVGGSRGTLSLWTVLQDHMAIATSPDPVAR